MKNLLVAQSGGPTSAINATLAGVVENALSSPSVDRIYGSINGIQGVLTENLIDLKTKLTNVSEEHRQKMFDNVKWEFIQEKGLSNGDTTKRSDIFKDYQLSVSKDKRLSGRTI